MITVLQILFVLSLITLLIILVFKSRRVRSFAMPEGYQEILQDYVAFYTALDEAGKRNFEDRLQRFLQSVKITGANADVEDLDRILVGAAAVIPVYAIPDWEYVNLREVLLYPGNFNNDFDQHGHERNVTGMVGTGALQNVMILSKWELRQGFINAGTDRNTAIHEFVHLVDKMDGTLDGVPEILLPRKDVPQWKALLEETMLQVRQGVSDIDPYAATSPVECFAVISEYFFTQPQKFNDLHPELAQLLQKIFIRQKG
ncbi:zinc-dependent peptidase [Flavisolibacter sp. BT320]|nr:zinc-dependent peptidase [Flavisolibacter longurius]